MASDAMSKLNTQRNRKLLEMLPAVVLLLLLVGVPLVLLVIHNNPPPPHDSSRAPYPAAHHAQDIHAKSPAAAAANAALLLRLASISSQLDKELIQDKGRSKSSLKIGAPVANPERAAKLADMLRNVVVEMHDDQITTPGAASAQTLDIDPKADNIRGRGFGNLDDDESLPGGDSSAGADTKTLGDSLGGSGGATESTGAAGERIPLAIISACAGDRYDVVNTLSTSTKARYAKLYGLAFYDDSDLVSTRMNFNQISASRIAAFRRHWDDHEWVVWTDADVLITNAEVDVMRDIVWKHAPKDSNVHVIMSKDWGGRQVNPAVSFIRTTPEGKEFLDAWEAAIANPKNERHDDLLAIRDDLEKNNSPVMKYVKFIQQHEINSYVHISLRFAPYNKSTVEHSESHDLWEPGDFVVHIVNCFRQPHLIDQATCDGLAAWYYAQFRKSLNKIIARRRVERFGDGPASDGTPMWMESFPTDVCLS